MLKVVYNTIYLYRPIGRHFPDGISDTEFISALDRLEVMYDEINLRVNSPGGAVFQGFTMFNAIKRCKVPVIAHIDGLAASMASLIPLACDKVYMAENALYMIHFSSGGARGTAQDLEASAKKLKQIDTIAVDTYLKKSNLPKDEIRRMMNEETFMTAKEAKKYGFIDEITGEILAADAAVFTMKAGDSHIEAYKFFKSKNTLEMEFDMKFYEALGLGSETTPEAVLNKVVEMKATITKLEKEKSEMQKSGIKTALDAAVNDRRIDENQRPVFQALLEKDFENGVKALNSLTRPKMLSDLFKHGGERSNLSKRGDNKKKKASTDKPRSEWNLMDFRKYDPQALKDDPELSDRLTKERLNTD